MNQMPAVISDLGDRLHVCRHCHTPILKDKKRRVWVHTQKQIGRYWRFVEACEPDEQSTNADPIRVESTTVYRPVFRKDQIKMARTLALRGYSTFEIAKYMRLTVASVRSLLLREVEE